MTETDYTLVHRLTNIQNARRIIADCFIEQKSELQKVLYLLDEEICQCYEAIRIGDTK